MVMSALNEIYMVLGRGLWEYWVIGFGRESVEILNSVARESFTEEVTFE